ncbi:GerAB/ArcD/ProY family transporter [Paenibacillus arenilitoris]|uniref:Endospore germination permease n=1 Tax=Paenibacillus arenilitoris TaxID=2772299 RepID=A0A927CLZ2_9BACL|nr:endospore germination permease [Paenibacillus arenilitoris]MBD2870479.1 endospore germination permease [Paenibacillus arenilitoris]
MKQKITSLQATAIIANAVTPSALMVIPNQVIQTAKQDGWLSPMLSFLFILPLLYIIVAISRRYNGKPLMEWLEGSFGKAAATGIALLLGAYYLIGSASIVRQFSNFISQQFMITTPLAVVALLITIVAVYICAQGVEVIGRVSFFVMVVSMLFLGINLFLLWGQYDWHHFLPVFETMPLQQLTASVPPVGWLTDITVVLLLMPYMKNTAHAGKAALWGAALASVFFCLIIAITLAVLGAKLIASLSYPVFTALGTVQIGEFIERIDVVLIMAWIASMFTKASVFVFCFNQMMLYSFRLRPHNGLYIAIGLFVAATALYSWSRNSAVNEYIFKTLTIYKILNNFTIFLLIWIGLLFAGRKANAEEAVT